MSNSVHVVCGHCHAVVRVSDDKLGDAPRCPQCHEALLAGEVYDLTTAAFDKQATRNDLPLVIDVWAPWCGPCKMMAPGFAAAAQQLKTRARFVKVNSDEEPQLAARFGIRSIPTLIVLRNGKEVARQSGAMQGSALVQWLQSVL